MELNDEDSLLDTVIIGAGQAGLSISRELQKANISFLTIDSSSEIGSSWLNRWDSLRLFTPTEANHLQDFPFPAAKGHYPNKYEVANYLKKYVDHFDLPVQLNTSASSVSKENDVFRVSTNQGEIKAKSVTVASGPFHIPFIPPCSENISEEVVQLHSKEYKNLDQLKDGKTLVVGAGDSGFQILDEVSKSNRPTYFSGETRVKTIPQQFLGKTLWWWLKTTGFLNLNKYSKLGKKISEKPQPIIGTDVKGILNRDNVQPVGMTLDADQTEIKCEKARLKDIKNIIWATGYRPNFKWIKGLPLDKKGYPENYRGVSKLPGVFFIGLPWMYTRGSATLGGVASDAEYLINPIQEFLK